MPKVGPNKNNWTSTRFYPGVLVALTPLGKQKLPRYAHLVGTVIARPAGATVRIWWGMTARNSAEYIPKEWVDVYSYEIETQWTQVREEPSYVAYLRCG